MVPLERFLGAPEIILTIIHDYIDEIEDFISIRHTCSTWLQITTTYEKSISELFVTKAFPRVKRLVEPYNHVRPYIIRWLIQLVPRQLSAILVDRHRFVGDEKMFGIPAEDPMGDELRIRVANGFRILRKLSIIAQEVYVKQYPTSASVEANVPSLSKVERRIIRSNSGMTRMFTSADVAIAKSREALTFQRRKEYVRSLSTHDREDYQMMSIFLIGCFENLWRAPKSIGASTPDGPLDFGLPPRRWIGGRNSWANWYILYHGPMLFWDQWWSRNPVCNRSPLLWDMERDLLRRSKGVMNVERNFAQRIEKELQRGLDCEKYNPPPELTEYQEMWERSRRHGFRNGFKNGVPTDTLGCISFAVDDEPAPRGMHENCERVLDLELLRSDCLLMWSFMGTT